jgi:radical SAM superfamily enzyme YgiQ (UPF0313 family)
MPSIVISAINAKYLHASLGARYLLANLGDLRPQAALVEFDINQRANEIAEGILSHRPRIVGLGVYIWNATLATEVVALLKAVQPEVVVIVGGPEISHETKRQRIGGLADYVIAGEADLAFAETCRAVLEGRSPSPRLILADPPDLERVASPYSGYTDQDLAHRLTYVEASRGCPFGCEFCLSSRDLRVRRFPLPVLLKDLEILLERGARRFKFVDRTFNLYSDAGPAILRFFLGRICNGLSLHFEMIPDRFPGELRELVARFPAGVLQFEIGIQTFNEEVAARIGRRQDNAKVEENLGFLRERTGVHVHADLLAGLPGETFEEFGRGFDRLVALRPQEIQIELLKRLRGTAIGRHDAEWGMTYGDSPPYEILQNRLINFATMQRLRRFARHWDLIGNSGNFVESMPLIWKKGGSPFGDFLRWSEWLHAQVDRDHGIALVRLAELLFRYLTGELRQDPAATATVILRDYQRGGRSDVPPFLREHLKPGA